MATEGIKQLKFANRQNVLATTHVVALVTVMGDIRAEYVAGTEQYVATPGQSAYWVYQFNILEVDIPPNYTFEAITESVFEAPYVKAWTEGMDSSGCCHCFLAAEMEIEGDPSYLIGAVERATDCEDQPTEFCFVRLEPDALATVIQPHLDSQELAASVEEHLTIQCVYGEDGDPILNTCP